MQICQFFKVDKSFAAARQYQKPLTFYLSKKPFTFSLSPFSSKDKNDDHTHIPG